MPLPRYDNTKVSVNYDSMIIDEDIHIRSIEEQEEINRICKKYQLVESDLIDLTSDPKDLGKTFFSNIDPLPRNGNELTLYIREHNGMWDAIGYVTRDITHVTESFAVKHFTLEEVYKYSIDIYFQNY